MDHHPMQFFRKCWGELLGIVSYSGDRDIKFALQSLRSGVIKGDDVRVTIVLEMGPVEVEKIFVAAENDRDRFYLKTLIMSHFK